MVSSSVPAEQCVQSVHFANIWILINLAAELLLPISSIFLNHFDLGSGLEHFSQHQLKQQQQQILPFFFLVKYWWMVLLLFRNVSVSICAKFRRNNSIWIDQIERIPFLNCKLIQCGNSKVQITIHRIEMYCLICLWCWFSFSPYRRKSCNLFEKYCLWHESPSIPFVHIFDSTKWYRCACVCLWLRCCFGHCAHICLWSFRGVCVWVSFSLYLYLTHSDSSVDRLYNLMNIDTSRHFVFARFDCRARSLFLSLVHSFSPTQSLAHTQPSLASQPASQPVIVQST